MDILVKCRKCDTENTVTIAKGGDSASPRCLRCDDVLMRYTSVSGYIYILSNPRMKDLLKIGLSTRSVQERIAELSSATGVPLAVQRALGSTDFDK
jgi:phage FluMu protein Com